MPASVVTQEPVGFFMDRFGLTDRALEQTVGRAIARRADLADLYFEFRTFQAIGLEDGIVKTASQHVDQGVGVRVVAGDKTGYAHSDEVTVESLAVAGRTAEAIALEGGDTAAVRVARQTSPHDLYTLAEAPIETSLADKLDLLSKIDVCARRHDARIKNVIASIGIEHKIVVIVTSSGEVVGDVQPLVRLSVACVAEENGQRQKASSGTGGRVEYSFLLDGDRWQKITLDAADQALRNLAAAEAPAGPMKVVLGPGWPGVLLHEAIGHGLEGDFNRKKTSAFSDLMGQPVASELCTVVDDGTLPNRRGSLNVDDEGTPTGRTVLIEKGILRGYLQDRMNARLMGVKPTGNGRRESFAHIPMPRMTNTFMLNGESTPEDVIRSVDKGLFAANFGGGQVDITSGKFVFSASEAYLIEGGKITKPVKGATLIGNGPDVLKRISMVGNDLALDDGIGTCGKDGQSVPVGVGLPTVRIDELTVGGTQAG